MIIEMSNKVLYSKQDSKTPLKVTLFTIGLNILISYFLSIVIGIKGIAYGTTIANLVGAFIMVYILRYEENIRILNNLKDFIVKQIIFNIFAFIVTEFINNILFISYYDQINIFFLGLSYFGTVGLFNIFNWKEIKDITKLT